MAEPLTLVGYGPSVYTRIVRLALIETGLSAAYVEADPFAPDPHLAEFTLLGRVPVLRHGDFTLTETAAILRYLARLSARPLMPQDLRAAARMDQVMGVVDAYVYVPLVRKVFAHGYLAPLEGAPHDPGQVALGLAEGAGALATLDTIAAEGLVLNARALTLADIHLAPMIDYLVRVPDGQRALARHRTLAAWWEWMRPRVAQLGDPFA